jgi:hypothetical protein
VGAGIVALIAFWYGEEDWRGERAWNQYRKAAEARGESLDFAAYIPKPVPDEQNFAATPFLKSFLDTNNRNILTNDLYARADAHISETNIENDRGHRHFVDLVAWHMASVALQKGPLRPAEHFETDQTDPAARSAAARAVLEGMKPDDEDFATIRTASFRTNSRFSIVYDMDDPSRIVIPHLAKIKSVCLRLRLQACAELAAGEHDKALADVKLMLSLDDSIKSEPFLVSYFVRVACVQIAVQPVWEGLAGHRWNDAQLQELQACFSSFDFLKDIQQPLKAERANGVIYVDLVKKYGLRYLKATPEDTESANDMAMSLLGSLIYSASPSGWYCQEKLNYCTLFDAQERGVVDLAARVVSPSITKSNEIELTKRIYGDPPGTDLGVFRHHRIIAAIMLPSLDVVPAKIAAAQTAADQAALACALERYRLANGQFPETLAALTPKFISRPPNDVITGQPYKYRRTDDGQFVLYSVGWNEKDDGGIPGKSLFDTRDGDWVWSYPGNPDH